MAVLTLLFLSMLLPFSYIPPLLPDLTNPPPPPPNTCMLTSLSWVGFLCAQAPPILRACEPVPAHPHHPHPTLTTSMKVKALLRVEPCSPGALPTHSQPFPLSPSVLWNQMAPFHSSGELQQPILESKLQSWCFLLNKQRMTDPVQPREKITSQISPDIQTTKKQSYSKKEEKLHVGLLHWTLTMVFSFYCGWKVEIPHGLFDSISGLTKNEEVLDVAVVQSLSYVWLFVTPWTAARQTSLSLTMSRSLLKFMSVESVIPSNHLSSAALYSFCLQQ